MRNKILSFLIGGFLFSAVSFADLIVDLSQGTNSIFGSFTGKYSMEFSDPKTHRLSVNSDVGFGHFVADNFMVGFMVKGGWNYSDGFRKAGGKVIGGYFFDTHSSLVPYLGLSVDPMYNFAKEMFSLGAGLCTGLLLSLSESVALDFGIHSEVGIKLRDTDTWKAGVKGGFMGVRMFY